MEIVRADWKQIFGKCFLSFSLCYAFYKTLFQCHCLGSLDRNRSPVTVDFISSCSASDAMCGYYSSGSLMFADGRWLCTAGHNKKKWKCCLPQFHRERSTVQSCYLCDCLPVSVFACLTFSPLLFSTSIFERAVKFQSLLTESWIPQWYSRAKGFLLIVNGGNLYWLSRGKF